MRKKDVVLMATVTSFESLPYPSRSELRQFAELFAPLFSASSEEARREAVAALSQCATVPAAVAFFIASQPIAIAAPFLIGSPCLSDETLVAIARMQGGDHARTIAKRAALSPTVLEALVGMRFDRKAAPPTGAAALRTTADADRSRMPRPADIAVSRPGTVPVAIPAGMPADTPAAAEAAAITIATADAAEATRLAREEELRSRIKTMAGHRPEMADDRLGLRHLSDMQASLLVRFARARDMQMFSAVLSDALSASRWLAQRILIDISGRQLATTLKGLYMAEEDALFVLEQVYSHLARVESGERRSVMLWAGLRADECGKRLDAWRRADGYTYASERTSEFALPATQSATDAAHPDASDEDASMARPLRTSASIRRVRSGR